MDFLIFLTASIFIIIGGLSTLHIFLIIKNLDKKYSSLKHQKIIQKDAPNILLLVPVLNETNVIRKSLKYFSRFQYFRNKLKIIFITSERESNINTNKQNTITIIEEILPGLNNSKKEAVFSHIHFESMRGVKSDQLNYTIRQYHAQNSKFFNEKTYIGIYDVDSVSPLETCLLLAKDAINNGFPYIYQQPTLYFKNYQCLSNSLDGFLSKSFSFIQTSYAISHEALNLMWQSFVIKRFPFIFHKSRYCIGHGLFVKWTYLKRIGLFPSPIEDTRLGHISSCLKEDIKVLPIFDTAEVARGVINKIQQSSNWFLGVAMCFKDMEIARNVKKMPRYYGYWLTLHRIYRNFVWMLRGPLFITLLAYLLCKGIFFGAFLAAFLFLWLPALALIFNFKNINKLSAKRFYRPSLSDIAALILMPAELFLMSVGPIYGLFKFFLWSAKPCVKFFYKTVR